MTCKQADEKPTVRMTRREAGEKMLKVGWWSLSLAGAASVLASIRFMLPKALFEPPTRFLAGRPEEYAVGEVSQRYKDQHKVWIVRDAEGIYAMVAQCSHLGCRPNWFGVEQRFRCPCHGSIFDRTGQVLGGPAPTPLLRASVTLDHSGRIVVDRALTAELREANRRPDFRISADKIGLPTTTAG